MEARILHRLLELLDNASGSPVVTLVTLVAVSGTTPRSPGTQMLLLDGELDCGSIGGGWFEAEATRLAQALETPTSLRRMEKKLPLPGDPQSTLTVWIERWQKDSPALDYLRSLQAQEREEAYCLTVVETDASSNEDCRPLWPQGQRLPLDPAALATWVARAGAPATTAPPTAAPAASPTTAPPTDAPAASPPAPELVGLADRWLESLVAVRRRLEAGEEGILWRQSAANCTYTLFAESVRPWPRLVLLGAGHVARSVCALASLVGWAVDVVDERRELLTPAAFPSAKSLCCSSLQDYVQQRALDRHTAVILVGRDHALNEQCIGHLCGQPLLYVGMMGSLRGTRAALARLAEEGLDKEWLDSVRAPIGLDLGGEGPQDVALAAVSELVAVVRGGRAQQSSLSTLRRCAP